MSAPLDPEQGALVRAIGIYLSESYRKSMVVSSHVPGLVVESLASTPWASLTFVGVRHHLVARVPLGAATAIDATRIALRGRIVALEREVWTTGVDGDVLTLDLLALDDGAAEAATPRVRREPAITA